MSKILVIGSTNMDMVVHADHMPAVGETVLSTDVFTNPGGKGANQAYALARLGGAVSFAGAVGADENGRKILENLKTAGVEVSHVAVKPEVSTGAALIMVNRAGDNRILVLPGANNEIGEQDIRRLQTAIAGCDILVMQLEIPPKAVLLAAKTAKALGKMVILDPAPVPGVLPEGLLSYVDLIKPNETELFMLAGEKSGDIDLAISKLRQQGAKDIVVTLGEKGVLADCFGRERVRIPGIRTKAVDTTAAGDSFTAAMAVMLAAGKPLLEAVEYANFVGSVVVTRKGAQASIPGREEVARLADAAGLNFS